MFSWCHVSFKYSMFPCSFLICYFWASTSMTVKLFWLIWYLFWHKGLSRVDMCAFLSLLSSEASPWLWGPEQRAGWDPAGAGWDQRGEAQPALGAIHWPLRPLATHHRHGHQQRHAALRQRLGKRNWQAVDATEATEGVCVCVQKVQRGLSIENHLM